MHRRELLGAAALGLLAAPSVAQPSWPDRPVRLLVGFAPGGTADVIARLLAQAMTADLGQSIVIENRSGAQAVQEMAAGRIQVAMEAYSVLRGPEEAGQGRILAVAAPRRSALAPAVPTTAEAGVPDYAVSGWQGFFAPASVPPGIRARFAGAVRKALDSAPVREAFARQGFEPGEGGSTEFTAFVGAEARRWGEVIRTAGITAG